MKREDVVFHDRPEVGLCAIGGLGAGGEINTSVVLLGKRTTWLLSLHASALSLSTLSINRISDHRRGPTFSTKTYERSALYTFKVVQFTRFLGSTW